MLEKLGEKFPAEILLQFLYAALQETSSETDRKKDGERGKKRVEMSFCDSSGDADLTYSLLWAVTRLRFLFILSHARLLYATASPWRDKYDGDV